MSARSPIDVLSSPGSDIVFIDPPLHARDLEPEGAPDLSQTERSEYALTASTPILLTPDTPELPDALSAPLYGYGTYSQPEGSTAESSAAGSRRAVVASSTFVMATTQTALATAAGPLYDFPPYDVPGSSAAESSAAGSSEAVMASSTCMTSTAPRESEAATQSSPSKRPQDEQEASCRRSKRRLPRPEYNCRKALDNLFQHKGRNGETSLVKKKTWKKKASNTQGPVPVPPVGVNVVVKAEPVTPPPEPIGLSLSVTPPCWVDEKPDVEDLPPIEIRNAGSRGRGLYALRAFNPGDIIYAETPLITARKSDSDAAILDKILALPLDKMRVLWQLETSGGYQPMVRGLFDANTIPCYAEKDTDVNDDDDDEEDEPEDGIFEFISRINHSCSPNAGWYWSNGEKKLLLVASQAVDVGDELVATYMDPRQLLLKRSERKNVIESISGFKCSCPTCGVNYNLRSDTNRTRLAQLFKGWEAPNIHKLVVERDILSRLHEAAKLARAEGLEGLLLDVFLHEFYVLAAWKKEARAKQVAGLALDALQRSRGRTEASNHFVARFAADPKSWASYGFMVDEVAA